jgi:hypothetical protein
MLRFLADSLPVSSLFRFPLGGFMRYDARTSIALTIKKAGF